MPEQGQEPNEGTRDIIAELELDFVEEHMEREQDERQARRGRRPLNFNQLLQIRTKMPKAEYIRGVSRTLKEAISEIINN